MLNAADWDSPVTISLQNGGFARFQTSTASRIVLLDEMAAEVFGEQTEGTMLPYRQLLEAVKHIGIETLAAHASPFLNMNVNRCFEAISAKNLRTLHTHGRYAVAQLFDSMFQFLPIGTSYRIPAWQGEAIVLPNLGMSIKASSGDVILERQTDTGVCVRQDDRCTRLGQYDGRDRAVVPLLGQHSGLLIASSEAIYEPEYISAIIPDLPEPAKFAELVSESLELISLVWPSLSTRIGDVVRNYVPIRRTDAQTHNSFSAENMVGVIFLSESYEDLKLAEAIVHEFHHNELYMHMCYSRIFNSSGSDKLYYSPWRTDARPLFGLIHALYVFTGVSEFFRKIEEASSSHELALHCRAYRRDVSERLAWGCAQVSDDDLEPDGVELLKWIRGRQQRALHETSLGGIAASAEISRHVQTWQQRYPDLTLKAAHPERMNRLA
jgi:HEXXH motif-containing protein